jgi:regulator of protease activity HflC (stomatin/prohibitin superfamily)
LRNVVGQSTLDELLAQRDRLNEKIKTIVDEGTDPWGIKVSMVEVKEVQLPQTMQRAMAAQAEAERERRAKVVHAEGEAQAAEKLAEAAEVISSQPSALQLRYLQTLSVIATEKSSIIVFPLPMDMLAPILGKASHSEKSK